MNKKRSRTENFSLELNTHNTGKLLSTEEITETLNKAKGIVEPEVKEKKEKRIPFTTALTPENRALLEAAAHEGKENVADLLNQAIEHYFTNVRPLKDQDLKNVFIKLFEKKLK
jgi:hypothetical protein